MTSKTCILFASGDSRESANQTCWPAQAAMETAVIAACAAQDVTVVRGHEYDPDRGHGFLASQRQGMDAFAAIDRDAPVIIAEAVWQYSHHVLPGLSTHRGPILTLANWSGQWPGLVGMLNLNGSLTKAGIPYATLWSEDFTDDFFCSKLAEWFDTGSIIHDQSHVRDFDLSLMEQSHLQIANEIATDLRRKKAIIGVFDEGCMGMYNAIVPDALLMPIGIFKERLSQSALYFETQQVEDFEARAVYDWLLARGMSFHLGANPANELTLEQVLIQCAMYIAAVRLADAFDCDAIGIQYQQGLKDLLPATDLVEGMLNNADRPPVTDATGKVIRAGEPVIHFNEVDECAAVDALMINRVHRALGQPVETTLHDIRWGDFDASGSRDNFVWVFEISGGAPPAHHEGGWAGSDSLRQPPMYFPAGGGTLRGIARPGAIIWSRVYIEDNQLCLDIGCGEAVTLPPAEMQRRREGTTPEWPIMNAVLPSVSRDQLMGRHKSNHIQVAYAHSAAEAQHAMHTRAALAATLGMRVALIGC